MGRAARATARVVLAALVLSSLMLGASPAAIADGGAEAAAREAAARYDARVLDVKTKGDQYRVKLLLPSGKVKVVLVPRNDAGDRDRQQGDTRPDSLGRPHDAGREVPLLGEA